MRNQMYSKYLLSNDMNAIISLIDCFEYLYTLTDFIIFVLAENTSDVCRKWYFIRFVLFGKHSCLFSI